MCPRPSPGALIGAFGTEMMRAFPVSSFSPDKVGDFEAQPGFPKLARDSIKKAAEKRAIIRHPPYLQILSLRRTQKNLCQGTTTTPLVNVWPNQL